MKLSILMPVYNERTVVERCIAQVGLLPTEYASLRCTPTCRFISAHTHYTSCGTKRAPRAADVRVE